MVGRGFRDLQPGENGAGVQDAVRNCLYEGSNFLWTVAVLASFILVQIIGSEQVCGCMEGIVFDFGEGVLIRE